MIRRGVAADYSLAPRHAAGQCLLREHARPGAQRARHRFRRRAGSEPRVEVRIEHAPALRDVDRCCCLTGAVRVEGLETIGWVPGGVGDHLTSFGGALTGRGGQMPATAWIASGATASYGTVSEPCAPCRSSRIRKVLLLQYVQGSSVIEAYWKSVAWPQRASSSASRWPRPSPAVERRVECAAARRRTAPPSSVDGSPGPPRKIAAASNVGATADPGRTRPACTGRWRASPRCCALRSGACPGAVRRARRGLIHGGADGRRHARARPRPPRR